MILGASNIKEILTTDKRGELKNGVEEVSCKEMEFGFFVDLNGILFTGRVDFSGAVFKEGASFKGARFFTNGGDVLFEGAFFEPSENGVSFENVKFGEKGRDDNPGIVSFQNARFGKMDDGKPLMPEMDVIFSGASFSNAGGVDFSYSAFSNDGWVDFPDDNGFDFSNVTFCNKPFMSDW